LESETTYLANVTDMAIEYVYKLISCDPGEFDSLQKAEYSKLVAAGLDKIFEERAAYYDANVPK
jgi:putative aldouronate transport system substrate-binding protein